MAYVPDATNPMEPTDAQKASSMGLEFRTLKAYIQSTLLPLINSHFNNGGSITLPWNLVSTTNYGIEDATTAAGAFKTLKAAGVARGYYGSSEGTSGQSGGLGLRSEGFLDLMSGATQTMRLDSSQNVGIGTVNATISARLHLKSVAAMVALFETTAAIGTCYAAFAGSGGVKGYVGYGSGANNHFSITNLVSGGEISFYTNSVLRGRFSAVANELYVDTFIGNLTGTATAVPWTGVTGRPTLLSQFTNDIGAGGGGGVSTYNGRTGAVTALSSDVTGALGYTPYNSSNPSGYTTLSGVAGAGFQTSSGSVATAASATSVSGTTSNGYGTRTVSTGTPSGGADGDIWYQV